MHRLNKSCLLGLVFQLFISPVFGQSGFSIENKKGHFKQRFTLVNDLVLLPVEINGTELLFLLDTGVNSTLIFSLEASDSLEVKNATTIYLRGMGAGKPLRGLKSLKNTIKLGEAVSRDETIYIVDEEVSGLSGRLGVEVNGILGHEFFRNFIIEFNYSREFMKIYEPSAYKFRKCRRCVVLPLSFRKNKPFIKAVLETGGEKKEVDLLLDSGSGDAIWLFATASTGINIPEKSFKDFLGFGISGSVYGRRGRVESLSLGWYKLNQVTASFPDSLYIKDIITFEERDGSLGGQVLKRFNLVLDYPGKNLWLKPNSSFSKPFEYNMSGVIVEHNGFRIVKDFEGSPPAFSIEEGEHGGIEVYRSVRPVRFSLAPEFRIAEVRPDSPAEKAGLKPGDVLLKLNGRPAHKFSLDKISRIFTSRNDRKIKLLVQRDLREIEFVFRLKRIL